MEKSNFGPQGGKEVNPSEHPREVSLNPMVSNCVVGFYFTFDDKFHPAARAYYCKVADLHRRLKIICPLRHLFTIMKVTTEDCFFPLSEVTRDSLTLNMRGISCIEKNVKPHSLRIGGHTYYTVYGLDKDFRDYLARRKVNTSTQTYYRASPRLNIFKLRQFFERTFV